MLETSARTFLFDALATFPIIEHYCVAEGTNPQRSRAIPRGITERRSRQWYENINREDSMKREQLIQQLKVAAKAAGGKLIVEKVRGKGSHYIVRFNGRFTVVQHGEFTPQMERTIRRQLGL